MPLLVMAVSGLLLAYRPSMRVQHFFDYLIIYTYCKLLCVGLHLHRSAMNSFKGAVSTMSCDATEGYSFPPLFPRECLLFR